MKNARLLLNFLMFKLNILRNIQNLWKITKIGVKMESNDTTADNLLKELQNINDIPQDNSIKTEKPSNNVVEQELTEDNINEFVLKSAQTLIKDGLETIKDLKTITSNTFDDRSMSAFADIINATNTTISILNDINIQKRKSAVAKEIKQMDIDAKNKLALPAKSNNIILTDRESLLKMLENDKNIEKQIEGESKLITNEDVTPTA